MVQSSYHRLLVIFLIVIIFSPTAAVAAPGYSLTPASSQDAIEVPTKTVDNSYGSATINSVSRIEKGESVSVSVGVDSGKTNPELRLRDRDNDKLTLPRDVTNGDTESFDSSTFIPSDYSEVTAGTYIASLYYDNDVVAAHPIVVQGYDISATTSGTGDSDTTATISADVTKRSLPLNSDFKKVEVIIGNNDDEIQKEMTDSDGDGTYTTDVSTSGLDEKDYNTYVVVRGDKQTVLDDDEILAISSVVDLSVGDSSGDDGDDETDEEDDDQSDSQTGGQGGGQTGAQDDSSSTTDDSPPSPQDVKDTLNLVDPENEMTLNGGGESGEQTAENSETDPSTSQQSDGSSNGVTAVEFSGDTQQPVTVENYGTPTDTVEEELINSIASDNPNINPATNPDSDTDSRDSSSNNDGSESDVIEPTPSSESDDSSETDDTTTTNDGSDVRVVALSDITPQEESDSDETAATVTMSVDRDTVSDPDQLTVYKEEYVFEAQEEQWVELETTVTDSADDTFVVTAETTGFSLFAVTETMSDETQSADTNGSPSSGQNDASDGDSSNEETETQVPGFGIVTMAITLILTVALSNVINRLR